MKTRVSLAGIAAATMTLATVAAATPLAAQEGAGLLPRQVISANPFGLLLELFNAEYERVVSESSTAGAGGSTFVTDDDTYVNADVFWRFYPTGVPLDGWAFGAKAGVTAVSDDTFFGFGFDVNRSWILGRRNNFYVGIGFGLKRLFGSSDEDFDLEYIPTIRIVNIGIGF
jgi:hypothetical protein